MKLITRKTKKVEQAFRVGVEKGLLVDGFDYIVLSGSSQDWDSCSNNFCFKNDSEYVFGCFPSGIGEDFRPQVFYGTEGNAYTFFPRAEQPVLGNYKLYSILTTTGARFIEYGRSASEASIEFEHKQPSLKIAACCLID